MRDRGILRPMPPILPFLAAFGLGGVLLLFSKDASAAFASRGTATRREIELSRKARVPVAVMRAIGEKESTDAPPPAEGWPAGKGSGKMHQWGGPMLMRFEPHVFNRKVPSSKQMPSSGGTSASMVESEVRVNAFNEAFRRDPVAAVEATSWGRYQVLGGHFLGPMYRNDPNTFLNAWIDADWERAEDLSDEFFVYWWRANPSATRYANMPLEAPVRYGGRQRRVVDVIARKYNGSYAYANDKTRSNGSVKPGLMSTYRNQVAKGAPTTIV